MSKTNTFLWAKAHPSFKKIVEDPDTLHGTYYQYQTTEYTLSADPFLGLILTQNRPPKISITPLIHDYQDFENLLQFVADHPIPDQYEIGPNPFLEEDV